MTRRNAILALAASFTVAAVTVATAFETGRSSPPDLETALALAIQDERHAIVFYERVMAVHGERRPFANIVHAERRHEAALVAQYQRLGLTPPADEWAGRTLEVPATFREACDAAEFAEIANVRLYDELIAAIDDEQVRTVFRNLRQASADRHLRAFRRHGSGWHVLDGEPAPAQQALADRAEKARDELLAALLGRVTTEVASQGPAAAITVCKEEAPALAAEIARKHGVTIGRTSWKLRNPENTGPGWLILALPERPATLRLLADRTGRLGYVAPIRVMGACLACHGPRESIAADVRERLETLYPEDRATGFKAGDLRGWFWVEVPASSASPDAPGPPDGRGRGGHGRGRGRGRGGGG